MAATYQWQSEGRLLLNVVTGGESHEQRAYGDFLDKDARCARSGEFLHIVRELWRGGTVSHAGEHLTVENAKLSRLPDPAPPLYFGGSSAAAGPVAARHCDVYLTWGERPSAVAEKIEWIKGLAAAEGRSLRFGGACLTCTGVPGTGWRSHPTCGRGSAWCGAGTALVGSHEEVADRIAECHALGLDEFVLSGYPHLEEAYWFGEGVLPLLERRGLWSHPGRTGAAVPTLVPFAAS